MGDHVTFVAKKRELRLIVKPADRTFDEARRPVILRGERVEFTNHRFSTDDADLVRWLKQHPLYGKEFLSTESQIPTPIKENQVKMTQGADTTISKMDVSKSTEVAETYPLGPERAINQNMGREEVEAMIDKKLDSMLERFTQIIQTQPAVQQREKQKRIFTCPVPGCGMVFKSGIEVGRHKKLAHP